MAQVINPQVRLPNTQGINLQWCTLAVGIEKCNFKTMQQLLAAANKYVNENPCPATPVETTKPAVPPPPKVESNPLYKTRLCERYETEGACSYGSRCNFAHGITELRGKVVEEVEVKEIKEEEVDDNENMLFKTKLCERFMRDQFCQYGPKCHFGNEFLS